MDNDKIMSDWIDKVCAQLMEEGFNPRTDELHMDYAENGEVVVSWEPKK